MFLARIVVAALVSALPGVVLGLVTLAATMKENGPQSQGAVGLAMGAMVAVPVGAVVSILGAGVAWKWSGLRPSLALVAGWAFVPSLFLVALMVAG